MKKILSFLVAAVLGVRSLSAADPSAGASAGTKPNILLILADDLRPDCIGALGNPHIRTPHLDRLVKQGVSFRNCFVMGSNSTAVCTPSRVMLMTGRNLFNIPLDEGRKDDKPSAPVDFQMLRAAGYATFYLGKGGNTYNPGCRTADRCEFFSETFSPRNRDLCPDKVIAYLRESGRAGRPFYINFAISVPHDPLSPAPEDLALYQGDKLPPLPPGAMASHADFTGFRLRDTDCRGYGVSTVRGGITSHSSPEQMRQALAEYYAVITGYDQQIGRILDELERTGQSTNTIVIFASDNGLSHSDHGLIHKQSLYDSDNRVPLILRGPGIPAGEQRDTYVYLSDLLPTMLKLAGVPVPETIQAQSFAACVTDPAKVHRKTLYTAYRREIRTFRDQQYQIVLYNVCYSGTRYIQLFDLKADPLQQKNLAKDPAHASRVTRMIDQARQAGKELGETSERTNDGAKNALMAKLRFWDTWDQRHDFRPGDVQSFPPKYIINDSDEEWNGR